MSSGEKHMTAGDRAAYEVPPHVLHRRVDEQMVLLDLDSEQYFGLDEVGADMVARLLAGSVDTTIEGMLADWEVDRETLRRDLDALVASLVDAGLLRPVGCDD